MSVTLKVLNATNEVARYETTKGEALVVQAQPNVNYQLIEADGFGPQNIISKREGSNLVIYLDDGDLDADIIIEDYYVDGYAQQNQIVGLHENGNLYAYVPESGNSVDAISLLAEEVTASQALGGLKLGAPFWTFNPLWALGALGAVAAVAGIAAVAGSNKDSANTDGSEQIVNSVDFSALNEAVAAYQAALATALVNGTISPAEQAKLDQLAAAVESAKQTVLSDIENAKNLVGNNISASEKLAALVDQVNAVTLADHTANDEDDDGISNEAEETEKREITDLLADVKEAERLYNEALQASIEHRPQDGVFSTTNPTEAEKLAELSAAFESAKAAAQAKISALAQTIGQEDADVSYAEEMQAALDAMAIFAAPQTNDVDNDGITDAIEAEMKAQLESLFQRAENAQAIFDAELQNALVNGTISPEEANRLLELAQALEAAKENIQKFIDALPENIGATEGDLAYQAQQQALLDSFNAVVPAPNDSDNDGVTDAQEASARAELDSLVKEAQAAQEKFDAALAKANENGLISANEAAELADLAAAVNNLKEKAQALVDALPQTIGLREDDQAFATEQQQALNAIDAQAPSADDSDNDGISDAQEEAAKQAVENALQNAKDALAAYEDALAKIGDTISDADVAALNDLAGKVAEAKAQAQELIDALKDTIGEEEADKAFGNEQQAALDAIALPNVPAANDKDDRDEDGISNGEEKAAKTGVEEAVQAAKEAKEAYDKALVEAGDVITPEEAAQLQALADALKTAKDDAQALIDALPQTIGDSAEDKSYAEFEQSDLDSVELPTVPEANAQNDDDQDGINNGDEEAARLAVEDAIQKAKDAKAAYDNALAEAGDAISLEEAEKLAELAKAVEAAKADAQKLIDELPQTIGNEADDQKYQADSQAALDSVEQPTAPAANDADNDNIPDAVEEKAKADIDAAIQAAKDAKAAYDEALAKAGNEISPEEETQLAQLAKDVAEKKAAAQGLIDALPETIGSEEGDVAAQKAAQDALDSVAQPTAPKANDTDNDGILDDAELSEKREVEAAIKAAKEAKAAYDKALEEAGETISAAEAAELAKLADAVKDAKSAAQALIDELPQTIGEQPADQLYKKAVQDDLDTVEAPTAPVANENDDADNDGISNADEDNARAEAESAVQAAKDAKAAYDKALEEAGDVITPEEVAKLQELADAVQAAKEKAQALIDALPETIGNELDDQTFRSHEQGELNTVEVPTVPASNAKEDSDNDGISNEDEEAAKQAVENAIQNAKDALDAYNQALKDAGNAIDEDEKAELDKLAKAVEDSKKAAQELIDDLKNTIGEEEADKAFGDEQQAALDAVETPVVPEINDADKDDISNDDETAAKDAVTEAVQKAKDAQDAYEQALKDAGKAIDEDEKEKLDELAKAVEDAKKEAQDLIDALPTSLGEKADDKTFADEQQAALDEVETPVVPEINDADKDDISNDDETAAKDAVTEAVQKAKDAQDAYEQALKDAGKAIDEDEKEKLDELAKAVEDAKKEAQDLIDALPTSLGEKADDKTFADEQQAALDEVETPVVPEINDADKDDISNDDETAAKDAVTEAVQKAKDAQDAYEQALKDAGKAIDEDEKEKLDELAKAVEDAKKEAQDLIDALPTSLGEKADDKTFADEQQAALDEVETPVVPEINDADKDDISNDDETAAKDAVTEAVQKAKDAQDAYEQALKDAGKAIDEDEKEKLDELAKAVEDAKKEAQDLIDALPTSLGEKADDKTFADEQQAALDEVETPVVPEINDADKDDISNDDETAAKDAVTEAVQKAKDAQDAYEQALKDAGKAIDEDEKEKLDELAKAVEDAKKEAQDLIDALPTSLGEKADDKTFADEQQAALDEVETPVVPEINDADKDDISNDDETAAKDAVTEAVNAAKAAEEAYNTAKDAAEADGIISPQEAQDLADAAQEVETKKDAAQELIDALPTAIGTTESDNAFKDEQQEALNAVTVPEAPQTNDADNDGKADGVEDTAKQAVTEAVNAAKAAEEAYNTAKDAAEADGIISPQEAQDLADAAQEVETKKDAAQELIDALPTAIGTTESDNAFKEEQQNALNAVTVPEAPQTNDADNDGKADDAENTAKQAVTEAVNAAKAAEEAYNTAKAAAEADGIISPQEAQDLADAAQEVETKKDAAQELIDALPTAIGTTESDNAFKEEQQNALNAVTVPEAPQTNDADNDGKADDAENTAKQAVTEAVNAAKAAEEAYNTAKDAAEADGIISPQEAQDLADAAQEVETKKDAAQALIDALPTAIGTTDSDNAFKDEQQEALNAVTVPEAPQTNDADNDGKADDAENTAKQAVTEAVNAAKAAEEAYNTAKDAAEADGIISPQEAQDLADAAQEVETKKDAAQALIDALPTAIGTTDSDNAFKDEQQEALNAVTVPEAPQTNDADNDGKADDAENTAKQAVTEAVNAAKAAEEAYNEAKAAAEADGIISPQEAQDLADAAQEVETKKDAAQALIDALPTAIGTTDSDNAFKDEQQEALNAVTVPEAPQTNDADNDGKADDAENTAKQAVTEAVNAAKAAEEAYNEAKAAAEADGIISPQEAQDLADAAQEVETKKDAAQALIDALPTAIGTTDSDNAFKDEQQEALNAVTVPEAPQTNDADNDGKADDAENTAKQAVTEAVNAAKAAEEAYNEAKAAAEADGIISPQEAQDLADAAQEVETKKDAAQALIDALPTAIGTTDSDNAFKDEQQEALNAVTVPEAPQTNDADNDGKADDAENTAKQAVTEAVNAAKAAEEAYNEAKAAAEADGIISPQEAQDLADAAQEVETKKDAAQALIDALPTAIGTTDSDNAFKDEQQEALNAVTVPEAPQTNDADNDGKADDAENTAKQAVTEAVNAAKAAEEAYNTAKDAAEADGIISPQEAQDLADAAQEVETKKDAAQALIDALPTAIGTTDSDNAFKDEQQEALNAVTVPEAPQTNDADNDGKADDAENTAKQAVTEAVNAAKAAEEAYNTAKDAAEADGIISPQEAQDLADAAQEVETKKDAAQALIDALPTAIGTTDSDNAFKDEQQEALNAVTVPEAPQTNDADNDGKADDAENTAKQAVTEAVNAAKAAEEAYNEAKAAAEADGIISPQEAQDLADAAQEVETKKDAAQALIDALPTAIGTTDSDNAFKDEQQEALNAVTVPEAPQTNDADNDGKADDAENTAKQAVTEAVNAAKAAEEAYNTAKDAAEADGIISPQEAQDLADAAQEVETKKDAAQALIDALPTAIGTTDSDNAFKDEQQEALNAVTVPEAPQTNDADNDGKADDAENTAKQAVTEAVNAAKAAEEAYNTAKDAAEADGIISPQEAQDLADAAQEVETKKDAAQALIDALPTAIGTTDSDNAFKDEQQEALNAVTVPEAPQTNDADNDGKADDAENTAKQAVTEAVNAAKAAEEAYNTAKDAAEADGIISPQEAQDLADAAQEVETKKDAAQALIDALPTAIGTTDSDNAFKDEQQEALNAVTVPEAPQTNDADNDGKADDAENTAKQAVTEAVNAAKAAEEAYNTAKDAAEADGIISPQEAQDLADAAQEVETKKDAAQALIDALPTAIGTTDSDNAFKDEQQEALNAVTVPEAPQTNDADNDGITDTVENNAIKVADEKVKAAEAAKTEYENALKSAQADGIISRSEAEDLATKAATLNNAITDAKAAVADLTADKIGETQSDKDTKDALNKRIPEEVTPPVVRPQTSFTLGDDPYNPDTLGDMTASVDNSDDVAVGATWTVTYVSKATGNPVTLNLTKGESGWALDAGQTAESGVTVNSNGTIVFDKGSLVDATELTSVVTSGTETDTAATHSPITGGSISEPNLRGETLYDEGTEGANDNYDDVIVIDSTINDQRDTPIHTGLGDDTIVVGRQGQGVGGITNSDIDMGEGNDTLVVFDRLNNSNVDMGNGDNRISIGTMIGGSTIKAGSGDDVLEFTARTRDNQRHIVGSRGTATIDLGDGTNTVDSSKSTTGMNIRAAITTGTGNDTFELSNSILQPAASSGTNNAQTSGYIDSGAGNDVVNLGGTGSLIRQVLRPVEKANEAIDGKNNVGHGVNLGEGDDILNFTPKYSGTNGISREFIGTYENGEFIGGEGFDRLVFGFNTAELNRARFGTATSGRGYHTDNEFKFNLYLASGFEEIDMSHSGKHTLTNVIELSDATRAQYITPPEGAALAQNQGTIGNTGKTGLLVKGDSEDKVDLAGKGESLKQGDTLEYEGKTYDHYEYNGYHIYIQEGVQVI